MYLACMCFVDIVIVDEDVDVVKLIDEFRVCMCLHLQLKLTLHVLI